MDMGGIKPKGNKMKEFKGVNHLQAHASYSMNVHSQG